MKPFGILSSVNTLFLIRGVSQSTGVFQLPQGTSIALTLSKSQDGHTGSLQDPEIHICHLMLCDGLMFFDNPLVYGLCFLAPHLLVGMETAPQVECFLLSEVLAALCSLHLLCGNSDEMQGGSFTLWRHRKLLCYCLRRIGHLQDTERVDASGISISLLSYNLYTFLQLVYLLYIMEYSWITYIIYYILCHM